ncbi:TetR/AcrR family transcriptional regulator, transcriptional repressor for nem operon [Sphingomonas sp. F9_3S_D5_B_2]
MSTKRVRLNSRKNDPAAVRNRILDAAAELFQNRGYSETSIDAIMRAAGVSSGALHHHYPNKKALGLAVVRERVAAEVEQSWIKPVLEAQQPVEGIGTAMTAIADALDEACRVRGCPLNNLTLELAFADSDFRKALQPIFQDWRNAIVDGLRHQDESRSGRPPEELATLVVAAYSGAMSMAKTEQSTEPLRTVIRALERILPSSGG